MTKNQLLAMIQDLGNEDEIRILDTEAIVSYGIGNRMTAVPLSGESAFFLLLHNDDCDAIVDCNLAKELKTWRIKHALKNCRKCVQFNVSKYGINKCGGAVIIEMDNECEDFIQANRKRRRR